MTTILAIDDNTNNLFTLKSILESHFTNSEILTATNAQEGIVLAKKHLPDIILLDIIMPEMDGYEVCVNLKADERTYLIPIILITAILPNIEGKLKSLDAGAETILHKPINTSELIAQTEAILKVKMAKDEILKKKLQLEKMVVDQARELLDTNNDYKSLLDNIGEGIGNLNYENQFIYINQTGANIFEYSKDELLSLGLKDIMSEAMVRTVMEETAKASPGKSVKFHINIKTKSGIKKTLLITAMPDFTDDGRYNGSSGVFRDVTKNLQDEKLLKMQFELAKISSATNDLKIIVNSFLDFVLQSDELDCGGVYMVNQKKGTLDLISARGLSNDFINLNKTFNLKSPQAKLVLEGETIYSKFGELVKPTGGNNVENLKAVGIIPIVHKNEVLAVLNIASHIYDNISSETKLTIDYLITQLKSALGRISAEKENNQNIARYKSLVEGTKDAILIIEKGIITDCNKALVEMLKYKSKEDIINRSPLDFSPNRLIGNINPTKEGLEAIKTTVKNGFNEFDWILQKADGNVFWVEARLSLVTTGEKRMISVILHDLTRQRQRDEEIRKFKTITDSASYGCIMIDLDWKIIYCNQAFAIMHEYEISELLEKDLTLVHSKSHMKRVEELVEQIQNKGFYSAEEVWHKTKSGHEFPTLMNGILMKDENGNPQYISATASDITNIKRYEGELKSALEKANESDHLKAAFLSSISHELRTPLNAVIGFSQILASDLNHEETLTYAKLIFESGVHLQEIVEDIFYFSLVKSGQEKISLEKTDLAVLLKEIHTLSIDIQDSNEKHNIDFSISVVKNKLPQFIIVDQKKVRHILRILVRNAFKFTFEGTIKLGCFINDKDYLTFFVEDTGIGIPEHKKEIIFEFFRQSDDSLSRKFEGTGIGLAITQKLVELLGGKIWAESIFGKGSTFYFTIPLKVDL